MFSLSKMWSTLCYPILYSVLWSLVQNIFSVIHRASFVFWMKASTYRVLLAVFASDAAKCIWDILNSTGKDYTKTS